MIDAINGIDLFKNSSESRIKKLLHFLTARMFLHVLIFLRQTWRGKVLPDSAYGNYMMVRLPRLAK